MEETFHLGLKALFVNEKNEVLILEANVKDNNMPKAKHWDLPGGRIQKGETIEEGLKREVLEEIGVENFQINDLLDASLSKHTVLVDQKHIGLILMVFKCQLESSQVISLTDNSHLSFKWVNQKEAATLLSEKFSDQFINKFLHLNE